MTSVRCTALAAALTVLFASAASAQHSGGSGTHNPGGAQADHFGRHFDSAADWVEVFDGAGTGYFSVRLARSLAAPTVYAVDIEPSMVAHLAQRAKQEGLANVRAVLGGADRTNLPEAVDLVLVVDTFHHIPSRVAYFTALKARMKPGARLAIIDFRKGAPSGPPEEFRFTPDQVSAELAKAGFSLRASDDFLPHQHFLVYGVK